MALTDLKLDTADFAGKLVSQLSNTPSTDGVTATQLKTRFDAALTDVLTPQFNALIDMLKEYGAALLDAQAITGVTGTTLQAQLANLKTQIDNTTLGSVADGSITDAKLSQASGAVLDRLANHTHTTSNVTGLDTALAGKAAAVHTHSISNVTSLQGALDGKAAAVHAHAVADVNGLQTALDGKAASGHSHSSLAALSLTTGLGTLTAGVTNAYISPYSTPPDASSVPAGTLFIQYE